MAKCEFLNLQTTKFSLLQAEINKEYEIVDIDEYFEKSNNKNLDCSENLENNSENLSYNLKIFRRLAELGIIKGEKITLLKKSFLNKTLLIKIKGYALLINSEIANQILIK
ncbi:MAG: FeoA family protein [Clostridia bacterium]|nr:FeoA family protein [Clostridia bacterium]